MGVSIQEEAKGVRGLLAKSSPLLSECGTAAFQNPAAPAHSSWRAPPPLPPPHTHTHSSPPTITHTKKWLFIRILVLYCSVPHKRRFIMLEASPLFAERNNNLELSFLECIINVISSCLCPSVCVEWWVWAPGTDGLGTRAARL